MERQVSQRTARHYDITISSSPRRAPVQSLTAILKAFAAASATGEAVWRENGATSEIARVRFNKAETRAILLFRFAEGEREAVTAHLVFDLSPGAGVYHAIADEAPRLTRAQLEHGIGALARRHFAFYAMGPRGSFAQAYPRLSFAEAAAPVAFTLERELAACELEIRPDVSVKLDTLLKQRATRLAA